MESVIFFAEPPKLNELCGITVNVKMSTHLPSIPTQPHIIKCREIIFTEPDIIASPSSDFDGCFNIVLQQSGFKAGRIQMRLQKHGLGISKPYRVHPTLYQSCLHYTLTARLAPLWNRAGEWFINGQDAVANSSFSKVFPSSIISEDLMYCTSHFNSRDFLVHDGYTNAVKMNLSVSADELFISLTGTIVKFPPLQVETLNLSKHEMEEILLSTEAQMKEVHIADCWCHVLPSMKRGKICTLSLVIPKESPFTSYKDLARYWKNMYGYRLPETDEDILYCQVSFLPSGVGKQFTYPNMCLRAGPVQVMQRVDPKPVMTAFLQDIHRKMTNVCGESVRFQPKLRYPTPSLHSAGQENKRISLSTKPLNRAAVPLKNAKVMLELYKDSQQEKKTTMRERLCDNIGNSVDITNERNADMAKWPVKTGRNDIDAYYAGDRSCNNISPSSTQNVKNLSGNTMHLETAISALGFTNKFLDKKAVIGISNVKCPGTLELNETVLHAPAKTDRENFTSELPASGKKYIPLFRPKARTTGTGTLVKRVNQEGAGSKRANYRATECKAEMPFSAGGNRGVKMLTEKKLIEASSSSPTPVHAVCSENLLSSSSHVPIMQENLPTVEVPGFRRQLKIDQQLPSLPTSATIFKSARAGINTSSEKLFQQSRTLTCQMPMQSPKPCASASTVKTPENLPHQSNKQLAINFLTVPVLSHSNMVGIAGSSDLGISLSGVKRKRNAEYEDTSKKPRPKPQVQDLDVESLARAHQLSKVNTVTLMAWLKERGMACKARDKKIDLVERVNKYLSIHNSES